LGKGGMLRATGAAPAAVDDVVVFLPEELIRPVRQRRGGRRRTAPQTDQCSQPNKSSRLLTTL